jgi:hypothetical protein
MSCWYAQSRGWRGLLGHTISTGPPLIQREGLLDVQVGVARRLSHRYRDIFNTFTQGLARTCAVPPVHCVLAELLGLPRTSSRPPYKKTRCPRPCGNQLRRASIASSLDLSDQAQLEKSARGAPNCTQSQNKPFAIALSGAADRHRSKLCSEGQEESLGKLCTKPETKRTNFHPFERR